MTAADSPQRVLLVYPPGATARGMADALHGEGHDVDAVENVYRAVSTFTARPADLVVLGIAGLDDRDLEVIRVLRELRPRVYLLLAFPVGHRDRAVKALALGADSYLLEPFYLGEFLDIVRRGLDRVGRGAAAAAASPADGGALERLAGAVAHAINNPLQILELLLSEGVGGHPEPEKFRQETRRIEAVVEELLAFARKDEARPVTIDLNEILREAVPEGGGRRPRVRHELAENLPPLPGDPARLKAAFAALSGIRRARGQEGRLLVRSSLDDDEPRGGVVVSFAAPELLLTPEEERDLFRPFSGPVQGAVGLAAATARSVLEAHGGVIEVESRQGEGTRIAVRFPAPALARATRG